MNRRAICIPYCVDQSEPSRPIREIVELPEAITSRNQILTRLFKQYVYEDIEGAQDLKFEDGDDNDYGDIIVSYQSEVFMFVTLVYIK